MSRITRRSRREGARRCWVGVAGLTALAWTLGSAAPAADDGGDQPPGPKPASATEAMERMTAGDKESPGGKDSLQRMEKMAPDAAGTGKRTPAGDPAAAPAARAAPLSAAHEARIAAAVATIDATLERAWRRAGVTPAEPATDAQFLRRVSIDLIGRIPRVGEAREFLADPSPDRRNRLVEKLLASREHSQYMASSWHRQLVPGAQGTSGLEPWLADKFAADVPFDRIVREIIEAPLGNRGNASGPADFYRILGNKAEDVAAATSRTFLGTQIQCAQCHKHPFDNWTQEDFWGHAAFFAGLIPAEANGQPGGEDANREIKHPKTGEVVQPRFLGGAAAATGNRRKQLAAWMTSADNPFFARATANRTWGMLFGVGIVDPVDDMGSHNSPSQPEVLDAFARFFAAGWSNRDLFRVLTRTRAYGLASGGTGTTRPGTRTFAAMMIKPLNAQQLYNSLSVAYHAARPSGAMVARRPGPAPGQPPDQQAFLDKFRAAPGQSGEYTFGIPQAITLMNSDMFDPLRVPFHSAILAERTDAGRIDAVFLVTLARLPTTEERERFGRYLSEQTASIGRSLALVDIHWALINSAEFAFNH